MSPTKRRGACATRSASTWALDSDDPLGGPGSIVEVDETLIGGGPGNHRHNKSYVLGMLEKGGELIAAVVPDVKRATLYPVVCANVLPGSALHTNTLHSYGGLSLRGFRHQTVNHTAKEYVSPYGCTVNRIEGFWSMLKRGTAGTHIHVSGKHLPKYLAEFEYRWNMRAVPHLMLDRLMHSFAR